MKLHCARLLGLLSICGTLASAHAQTPPAGFPARPIRIIVGSAPGGGADLMARAVGAHLTEKWGRSVVVDNRGGGGGVIALEMLTQAPPDGYTLFGGASLIITATPMKKVRFDTRRVLAPVVQLTSSPFLLLAPPSLPANSVREFIALAKAKPNALSYGSAGVGSFAHLGTELFKYMAGGIDMVHVPYKGYGQALTDLMGGQIQLLLTSGLGGTPYLKSGRLKAIAVTSAQRFPTMPDVPTLAEAKVGKVNVDMWFGIFAPKGTPADTVALLNREINLILKTEDTQKTFQSQGMDPSGSSPEEFARVVERDAVRWAQLIKAQNIKAD
jgi:tripartite-type tricarboxylate transporter receptor subunit TctC